MVKNSSVLTSGSEIEGGFEFEENILADMELEGNESCLSFRGSEGKGRQRRGKGEHPPAFVSF